MKSVTLDSSEVTQNEQRNCTLAKFDRNEQRNIEEVYSETADRVY